MNSRKRPISQISFFTGYLFEMMDLLKEEERKETDIRNVIINGIRDVVDVEELNVLIECETMVKRELMKDKITLLHLSIIYKEWAIFYLLLSKKVDVTIRTVQRNFGCIELLLLSTDLPQFKFCSIATALFAAGIDPNYNAIGFLSPMYYAIKIHSSVEMIRFFIENGSDPNVITNLNENSLFFVGPRSAKNVYTSHHELFELLLQNGADPNLIGQQRFDQLGNDRIDHSILFQERAEARTQLMLLNHGADPYLDNFEGLSFLHHLSKQDSTECVRLIFTEMSKKREWFNTE